MSTLQILQAGPSLQPRSEAVDAPELGGAVLVRGLMASEGFALGALRTQALRRVREERLEHERRLASLPQGATPPEFEAPDLSFDELRSYGLYISHLLACAVVTPSGMALYSAEQWEVASQHHPGLVERLQAVAERLSGLQTEDVQKNSPPTPS